MDWHRTHLSLGLFALGAFAAACSGDAQEGAHERPSVLPASTEHNDGWWSAVAHLELDEARALDDDADRRAFVDALAAAVDGGSGAAEGALCALASGAADALLRRRAGQVALNLLRIEGRWESMGDFGERCGLALAGDAIPAALLALPVESVELPDTPVVLPLVAPDGRLPLVIASVRGPSGAEDLTALVDTGAGACVIAAEAARRLGVTPIGEDAVAILGSAGQGASARPGRLPELRLGEVRATDLPVLIVDTETLEALLPGIPFVIGWELLQRMVVEVSGATSELVLRRSARDASDGAADLVLLYEPVVRLESSGTELLFLLDTGATSTDATPALVERLRLTDLAEVEGGIKGLGAVREALVPEIPRLVIVLAGVTLQLEHVTVWEMPVERNRLLELDGTLGADVALAGRLIVDGPGRRVGFAAR